MLAVDFSIGFGSALELDLLVDAQLMHSSLFVNTAEHYLLMAPSCFINLPVKTLQRGLGETSCVFLHNNNGKSLQAELISQHFPGYPHTQKKCFLPVADTCKTPLGCHCLVTIDPCAQKMIFEALFPRSLPLFNSLPK